MKKLILILAVALIASPVFGALSVDFARVGSSNDIDIKYSGADANNLPRAFAMTVRTKNTVKIHTVTGYKANGESTSASKGYGIYPSTIDINSAGGVDNWGTPLAGGALDTNSVILEFGSLYFGDGNAPATSGTLCRINIVRTTEPNTRLILADEDTYRGGLVFEDGTLGNASDVCDIIWSVSCTQPVAATTPTPANHTPGVSTFPTKPTLSWTPAAGGVNPRYDVYFGTVATPVTIVSPNQTATSYLATTAVQGKTYYWKIVSKNDCNSTGVSSAIWDFNTVCYKSTSTAYAAWVTFGKPSCWCYQRNCRGDADGLKAGLYWVYGADLTILQAGFGKNDATLQTIANGICADFDRIKSGLYRVYGSDLIVLQSYFGKGATLVPVCNVATVNFWTN